MLKLIRNTLGDGGILIDKDGDKICWAYLTELQKSQEREGLRLGNKFKLSHIQWWQQFEALGKISKYLIFVYARPKNTIEKNR